MRKIISLLLALMLLVCPAIAEEEEEWTLEDLLADLDPELVADIFINAEEAQNAQAIEPEESIRETDGSILITITDRRLHRRRRLPQVLQHLGYGAEEAQG